MAKKKVSITVRCVGCMELIALSGAWLICFNHRKVRGMHEQSSTKKQLISASFFFILTKRPSVSFYSIPHPVQKVKTILQIV